MILIRGIAADEKALDRLVESKPGIVRRIADTIKEVIDRFRGVKDPQLDAMRRVEKYMRKALDQVEKKHRGETSGAVADIQFAADVPVDQRDQAYFDNIDQHDDVVVYDTSSFTAPRLSNGNFDKNAIMSAIKNNPLVETVKGRPITECPDISAKVEINTRGVTHAYGEKVSNNVPANISPTDIRNAKASMLIPDLLRNAIEVNRSKKYSNNVGRDYGHVLMSVYSETGVNGKKDYYAVRMVVEHNSKKESYDLIDFGVVGRLHAANAKKILNTNGQLAVNNNGSHRGRAVSTYKVADLINDVKSDFNDTFSIGAYQKVGTQRKQTRFAQDLVYAVPEDDLIDQQIDAWIDSSTALEPRTQLTAVFDDCMRNGFDL